jgi:hypothetical protein
VVRVHFQIALRLHREIEEPVNGEVGQHVIQKTDAGGNLMFSDAVNVQLYRDLCLIGLT